MLTITRTHWLQMVGHSLDGLPDEACGLLVGSEGSAGARVEAFVACRNADESSRTFSIGPDGWEAADAVIGDRPLEILGVVHSHTHTDAYPSPTDVDKAANPLLEGWHWVLVSLREPEPVLRSYVITDGTIVEEPIAVVGR
ncbi:MAG TPA: M67 family metallopeptidase [Acidimicrobiales bacterium]|nr:M67 family metallopeptidase [Acidimicrobiales bacterium]